MPDAHPEAKLSTWCMLLVIWWLGLGAEKNYTVTVVTRWSFSKASGLVNRV